MYASPLPAKEVPARPFLCMNPEQYASVIAPMKLKKMPARRNSSVALKVKRAIRDHLEAAYVKELYKRSGINC